MRAVGADGEAEALQRLLTESRGLVIDGGGALLGEAAAAGWLMLAEASCRYRGPAAGGGRCQGEAARAGPGGRAGRPSQSSQAAMLCSGREAGCVLFSAPGAVGAARQLAPCFFWAVGPSEVRLGFHCLTWRAELL